MAGCGVRRVAWHLRSLSVPSTLALSDAGVSSAASQNPSSCAHSYCADPPYLTSRSRFLTRLPKKERPVPLPQGSKAEKQSPRQPRGKRPMGALTSRPGPLASRGLPSHSNIRNECRLGEFGPWCTGSSRPAGGFLCGAGMGPCPKGVL